MERLTKRGKEGVAYWNGANGVHYSDNQGNIYGNAITKLAEYEDADEQGLLIRLPVAEGSTVYALDYIYECKYDYDCALKSDKNKCEENIPCKHEEQIWRVRETTFNYKMLKSVGTTIFLKREEAEAALAEMNKKENINE